MRLTYLGTAAAEGFPALFCNCAYCREARRLGGKNIRTRAQALVNDDLLIDFPADTYHHFLSHGIEGDTVRYLLLSHAHSDHLYPMDLTIRHGCYAHRMRAPTLSVVASPYVASTLGALPNVEVTPIRPFESVTLGPYRVTALPARHMQERPVGDALFYLIEGERTLLYAHDTGFFFEDVFDFLQKEHICLDMLSLDCTNADIPIGDTGSHMGFANHERLLKRLRDGGVLSADTLCYVNHFSHNGNPLHEHLTSRAATLGCHVSYDGCRVDF